MARKRRDESERSELVRRWRESGLPAERFAETHGVGASTLYEWARRERSAGAPAPAFSEVRVVEDAPGKPSGVRLEFASGALLVVDGTVDAQTLTAIVKVMAGC